MTKITESHIEKFAIEIIESRNYQYIYAPSIAPDVDFPERESFENVILDERLKNAVSRINPKIQAEKNESHSSNASTKKFFFTHRPITLLQRHFPYFSHIENLKSKIAYILFPHHLITLSPFHPFFFNLNT